MTIVVITNKDLDAKTSVEKNQKLTSNLVFTEKEATVPSNTVTQFLFRELDNSNQIMACTGIQVDGVWYGDGPDDVNYTNPFTSQVLTRGNPVAEKSAFIMKEDWSGNTIQFIRWDAENPPKLTINRIGGVLGSGLEQQPDRVTETTLNGQPAKHYIFSVGNISVRFQEEEEFDIVLNGVHYAGAMPRLAFENSLGTFGWEASNAESVLQLMPRRD